MTRNMRRHLPGAFVARDLGNGAWRLSRIGAEPLDVWVRGADAPAADALRPLQVHDIGIEWRGGVALLRITSDGRPAALKLESAIVHEPRAELYRALPLADFDPGARRFWRRVFRLVRIPGGRFLLGVLARRSRDRH